MESKRVFFFSWLMYTIGRKPQNEAGFSPFATNFQGFWLLVLGRVGCKKSCGSLLKNDKQVKPWISLQGRITSVWTILGPIYCYVLVSSKWFQGFLLIMFSVWAPRGAPRCCQFCEYTWGGGVGWGWWRSFAFAHMFDATPQDVSLGLAHMFNATQQDVSCGGGVGWGGDDDVHLHLHTCLMLRHRMFLSDLHTCLMLRNRMFHVGVGWGGVGMMTFICICTHVWCYATGCFSRTCTHV